MITDEELKSLEACQSAQDWRNACDKIKAARGGMYPEDWWDKVKLSGMMDKIMARWGENSELTVTTEVSEGATVDCDRDDYLNDYLTDPIHYLYQEKDTGLWGICFRNWDIGFGKMQKDKEDCIKEFRKVYPDRHLYEDYKSANKEYQKVMLKRAAKLRQRA